MKLGNLKNYILFIFFITNFNLVLAADKIETVPLINLEELSPTFEENKDELDLIEKKSVNKNYSDSVEKKSNEKKISKVYINIKALDKITAKTSSIRLTIGEINYFGSLEIKALKCELSENDEVMDTVAYLQVKDLSTKDNNQVFLFNGWTFASSPTLRSIDHPVYDLWVTGCENI
jgi:hypothetical protein